MTHPNPDEEGREHAPSEAEIGMQKEAILKQILDSQARMRLGNIRMVKPEQATMLENYLINMASQGKIGSAISDEQLKRILLSMQQPKRDFKISRL